MEVASSKIRRREYNVCSYNHPHLNPLPAYVKAMADSPSRARKVEGIKICLTNIMELYRMIKNNINTCKEGL